SLPGSCSRWARSDCIGRAQREAARWVRRLRLATNERSGSMPRGKTQRTKDLIAACVDILREIQPASVRAVCYRLFTLGFIESMAKTNTNKVSAALTYAREEGFVPWEWIVDETREAEWAGTYASLESYARLMQRLYRRDRWQEQPRQVEVWSEKGTV